MGVRWPGVVRPRSRRWPLGPVLAPLKTVVPYTIEGRPPDRLCRKWSKGLKARAAERDLGRKPSPFPGAVMSSRGRDVSTPADLRDKLPQGGRCGPAGEARNAYEKRPEEKTNPSSPGSNLYSPTTHRPAPRSTAFSLSVSDHGPWLRFENRAPGTAAAARSRRRAPFCPRWMAFPITPARPMRDGRIASSIPSVFPSDKLPPRTLTASRPLARPRNRSSRAHHRAFPRRAPPFSICPPPFFVARPRRLPPPLGLFPPSGPFCRGPPLHWSPCPR